MLYPVLISEIKATKKTARITGASNVQEFNQVKDSVFAGKSEKEIIELIDDVYNYKLAHSQRTEILGLSKEAKIEHLINNMSFQMQFRQETPREKSEAVNNVGFFLRGRLNVSNQVGSKVFYQTVTYEVIQAEKYDKVSDLSAAMAEQGVFVYLFRKNSFEPEVNKDGLIVSAPKTKGKGGNILCKTDPKTGLPRIIFQQTYILMEKVKSPEQLEQLIATAEKAEKENNLEFKSDQEIDVVENEIPAMVRAENGTFAPAYQEWLQRQLSEGLQMQTKIVAQQEAA